MGDPARTLTDADVAAIVDALSERFGPKKPAPKPAQRPDPVDVVRARVAEKLKRKGIR